MEDHKLQRTVDLTGSSSPPRERTIAEDFRFLQQIDSPEVLQDPNGLPATQVLRQS